MRKTYKAKPILEAILSFILSLVICLPTSAISDGLLDEFNIIGAFYYNPSGLGGGNGCYTGSIALAGTTAEEKIWSGLTSFMTPEQAAGVMGNMAHEGNYFNPLQHEVSQMNRYWGTGFDILNDDGRGYDPKRPYGIGLIQWSNGRRVGMLHYVQDNAPELLDYFMHPELYSIDYTINGNKLIEILGEDVYDSLIKIELEYLQKELQDNSVYGKLYDKGSVQDAADYFLEKVEVPNNIEATRPGRRQDAQKYYDMFNGVLLSPTGGCSGSIVSGGMTYDQAYALVEIYVNDVNECYAYSDMCGIYNSASGEPGANCSTFSSYFLSKYTTLGKVGLPDGKNVASSLANNYGFELGNTPRAYSIFSTTSGSTRDPVTGELYGHTGVVLGINEADNEIYIGQMGYSKLTRAWGLTAIRESLDKYNNGTYTYAYIPDDILKY